jgi:inner membrane transporter RhtA
VHSFSFSVFLLLIAITSIQSGASLAKQLFPLIGSVGATTLRLFLATLILFVIWRPWKDKLSRPACLAIFFYGLSLGCMNLLFYLALERIPLGIAVALEFTGPLAVALMTSRKLLDFIWTILAALGILLILPVSKGVGEIDLLGIVFALGAGCAWASYIVFGQKAGSYLKGGKATALGMLVASFVVLPVALLQKCTQILNPSLLPLAILVAVLSSALPYSLEMIALKRMPAKTFSILMSLEPVIAALAGLVFLNESLSLTQVVAIACIIVASLGSSLMQKNPAR